MRNRAGKSPTETQIQQAVIRWWGLAYRGLGAKDVRSLKAFPMQGGKGVGAMLRGQKMKAEGARTGTPDLFLSVARCGYHGLFIEMKRPGGVVSPDQAQMIALERAEGYCALVCFGFESARSTIEAYMTGRLIPLSVNP